MSHKRLTNGTEEMGLKTRSGRVVLTAIAINGCNFLFKACAWCYTGSHSLFSECIHSLADTDTAAVAGVSVAASCMALSQYTGNPIFDAVGSILVGTLLGGVASFIILSNVGALVGR
ncbi:Zinc transporter 9, partial [Operophtera brumata]